jgi:spermidine synthase
MRGNLAPIAGRQSPLADGSAFLLVSVGCLGIATQLVLLRELMAAGGGNELSAGVTVAAWILSEALGAWLAGRSSFIVYRSSSLAALSIVFSLAAVPAAVLVRPVFGVLPGEELSIPLLLAATFTVVLLPAASHSALFVRTAALRRQGIGSAYVWEGIGTAAAGVACYLLLNRLPSLAVVALSALPLVAATFGQGRTGTGWTTWTLGLITLALLVFGLPLEKLAWSGAWRGQRVTAVANSPYGKVVQMERAGQQLILYDGLPLLTVPTTQTERTEELSLLPILFHPAPRRVLVLGPDPAIPAALARFRPDIKVVAVELDPVLARASLAALMSDSTYVVHRTSFRAPCSFVIADPMTFLRTSRDSFDCIILTDAAPSSLVESRLFTREFYRLCRSRLAPGGLLATAGPGNPNGLSPDIVQLLATRLRTLKTAFRHVLPIAADFPLLLASDYPPGVSTETLLVRLARLEPPPRLLDSSYTSSLFDPFRQEALASVLAAGTAGAAAEVSSATLPRELFLTMVRENRLASKTFGALYARLGSPFFVRRSSSLLLLFGASLLVAGLVGARFGGRRFGSGFAVLTSGFSGAAVSSLLIFAWQVRFGSVFSGVALLVAAFMLGTVLGGSFGSRSSSFVRGASPFVAADVLLAAAAGSVLSLIHEGPTGVFLTANCVAGVCLGFQFALAGSAAANRQSPFAIRQSAGILTALDLVGGGLGGIVIALLIVPVLGIGVAALCAVGVKLISALVQLTPGRAVSQA